MSQKIDFNGFGHFPKGNAEIEIVNNQMILLTKTSERLTVKQGSFL